MTLFMDHLSYTARKPRVSDLHEQSVGRHLDVDGVRLGPGRLPVAVTGRCGRRLVPVNRVAWQIKGTATSVDASVWQ